MNTEMDLTRRTWIAAIKLALVISTVAAVAAIAVTAVGDIPQAAIVLPVMLVAFAASWIQTSRVRHPQVRVPLDPRRAPAVLHRN